MHSSFVCDQQIGFQQRTHIHYTQLPSVKATEGAELGSEGDIEREKVGSRLSTAEGTVLVACSETNAVLALPEWECSSVPHFLTVPSSTTTQPSLEQRFC